MRKVILYMQISLDGVVSDPENWMTLSDEIIEDALKSYNEIDTVLVGSNTYASLAEYWKNAEHSSPSSLERSFAKRINEIRKIVISHAQVDLVWNNSTVLLFKDNVSFVQEIRDMKKSEGKNISVESGVKTWQLFIENLIFDELHLLIHPVVARHGKKLFSSEGGKINLELAGSKLFKNGVMGMHYKKI